MGILLANGSYILNEVINPFRSNSLKKLKTMKNKPIKSTIKD